MSPEHAVWTVFKLDEFALLDHLRLPPGGGIGRQDAIRIAVQNQGWDLVVRQVLAGTRAVAIASEAGEPLCHRAQIASQ